MRTTVPPDDGAASARSILRRLTIGDALLLAAIGESERPDATIRRLDERTERLVRVAALIALDAPQGAYETAVAAAQRSGADLDDLTGILVAVAGQVGSVRVISAAPRLARSAGYDIDADLEGLDPGD